MAEQFVIRVVVDPTSAERGMKRVDERITRTERSANSLGRALKGALGFLATGAVAASGVRLLADFGQEMATVRAVTGATTAEFSALREEAKRLGAETRFSATDAAEGMVFLARAGFTARESLATIEPTLRLAQAGALGLGEAADISTNVLKGFRLGVDEATRVVDVLALTANSSNTNVQQLGDAMKFVAPVAAGLGVELEQAAAAAGALSNAGLQATLAGTGLRRVLSELEAPSAKSKRLLAELGVAAEEVRVSEVGLVGALERLGETAIDTGTALEIFGDRGGPAFEVLFSSVDDVKSLEAALQNAGGTADRVADIMDDTLKGSFLRLRSVVQAFAIELGDAGATKALRSFADFISRGFRAAAANIDVVSKSLEVLAYTLGVRLATQAIPAAIAGLRALTVAAISNPFTALGAAVTVAIGALIAFRDEIADVEIGGTRIGDIFKASFDAVRERAIFLGEVFSRLADGLIESTRIAATAMLDDYGHTFNEITSGAFDTWDKIAGHAKTGVNRMIGFISGLVRVVKQRWSVISDSAAVIWEFMSRGWQSTVQFFSDVLGTSTTDMAGMMELLGFVSGNVFKKVVKEVETASANLQAIQVPDDLGEASLEQLAIRLAQINDPVKQVTDAYAAFNEELGRDFIGEAAGKASEFAEVMLDGFRGLEPGAAVSAFLDITSDINERIAEREAIRVGMTFVESLKRLSGSAIEALFPKRGDKVVLPEFELPTPPQLPEAKPPSSGEAFLGGRDRVEIMQQVNEELANEIKLLGKMGSAREVAAQAQALINNLRAEGVELSRPERDNISSQLALIALLEDQADAYQRLRGPAEELARTQAALNKLSREGSITAEEYQMAILETQVATARLSNTMSGGFRAGFGSAIKQLSDVSSLAENTVVNAVGAMEDAFVQFATTGKLSFSDLLASIQADLARLLARQALMGLLNSLFPGGTVLGFSIGAGVDGARASGGPVASGHTYLVGEEGPELFTPPTGGTITPAGETAALMSQGQQQLPVVNVAPPAVTVSNVIVNDPSEIPSGIESPQGQRAIMNVLNQKKQTVRGLLS